MQIIIKNIMDYNKFIYMVIKLKYLIESGFECNFI